METRVNSVGLVQTLPHGKLRFHQVPGREDHARGGELRVDCTVTYSDDNTKEAIVMAHPHEDYDHDLWFQAYTPKEDDGCFIEVFFLSLDPFLPYVRAHSSHISP